MYLFTLNTYKCVKKPKIFSNLDSEEWFNLIKHSPYSEKITQARNGELDYDSIKESIPCVTYNFLFNQYKTDANIINGTGLMYIDIDDPRFNISTIDKQKVHSYYRSFGGNGYAIIVQVSGLTLNDYRATYNYITNDLGVFEYADKGAVKASQYNVLSYDSNIYYNKDSFVYSPIKAPQSSVIERGEKAYTIDGGAKEFVQLRFDNLDEVDIEGEYTVNWDGIQYIKCFIPMKKIEKNRNAFLLSYCNNLVYLNPNISESTTIDVMRSVNKVACAVPVSEAQLLRVIKSIHKYKHDGSLKPIYFKKLRKIVFNKASKLTREEKLMICVAENAKRKSFNTQKKMYSIIEMWDFEIYGNISQRKMYDNFSISKKTVEKYWKQFKPFIEEVNTTVKESA